MRPRSAKSILLLTMMVGFRKVSGPCNDVLSLVCGVEERRDEAALLRLHPTFSSSPFSIKSLFAHHNGLCSPIPSLTLLGRHLAQPSHSQHITAYQSPRCIFFNGKNKEQRIQRSFFFILFYFILFYFILFYFTLFYFTLFYFILLYFILFLIRLQEISKTKCSVFKPTAYADCVHIRAITTKQRTQIQDYAE